MDIVTISRALTSLKTAYELSKIISDSSTSLKEAEVKLKLADLSNAIADTKNQIVSIKSELIEKNEKIQELENKLKIQNELQFESPYYWRIENNTKDGPFCQKCYDENQKLIRLQNESNSNWNWHCLSCRSYFKDKNFTEESIEDNTTAYDSYI